MKKENYNMSKLKHSVLANWDDWKVRRYSTTGSISDKD